MRAGEVPDIYHERNSRAAEWAADRAWTYRRLVETEPLRAGERAWLRFGGIDDAGHVVLDGQPVASHEGMFVPGEIEVTTKLREGGRHELAVVVEPAPESQPQVGRTSVVRIHKARMTYGWDFCPRLVHQGLWGSVELITAGPVRLADVWARPSLDADGTSGRVTVRLALDRTPETEVAVVTRARLDGVDVADVEVAPTETVAELVFVVREPARDEPFVARMRREAESIVPLRRNHPSLAIWCGGNELQGPDGPLETARSPVLVALAEVVDRLDPDRIWLPTTPTGPRFGNRLEALRAAPDEHHDVHGPWEHQGLREQTVLWDAGTSRFNGEFGVEGMTTRRALERLIAPDHRWPADRSNPVYRHLGDWWNNAPLVEASFAGRIADLETLRRASQHLQADGLRYALEANRRRWPRNGGSIPWQLNESFPNAWCTSVVAHDGEPKPAFHAVRRAWARTLVCARLPAFVLDGSSTLAIEPWAWSEDGPAGRGTIAVRAIDADGSVMAETLAAVELDGRRPASPGPVALELGSSRGGVVFLDLALAAEAGGEEMARNRYALGRGSDLAGLLDLPPAELDVGVERDATSWCLTFANAGSAVAAGVLVTDDRRLDAPGWGVPDDSWFDLLAGEPRVVRVAWANDEPADRRLRIDGWNVAPIEVAAG
jgi:hypothetical protein